MRIIEDNIDKISLDEWEDGTHIWEAMLPEMRKHLGGEPSIFDGIQCNRQFEGYTEAGIALVESAVIAPCLENYWECSEKGAYTFEWTEEDDHEFSDYIKARWSYIMWLAYEAMNGTLSGNLTFKSTLGTTWEKILDEAWERDYKLVRMLCGKTTAQDVPAPADDNNSFPDLPF